MLLKSRNSPTSAPWLGVAAVALVLAMPVALAQEEPDEVDPDIDIDIDLDDPDLGGFDGLDFDIDDDIDDDDEREEDEEEDDERSDDDDDSDERDDDDEHDFDSGFDGDDELDFDDEGYPTRRNEILAFDMDSDQLLVAEDIGFALLQRTLLPGVGASIDRLAVPADFASPQSAIDALADALPAAPFDYNHIYELPEQTDPATTTVVTEKPGIGKTHSGQGVRLGIIDTLPDIRHSSLRGQSIEIRDFAAKGGRDVAHATAVTSILVGQDAGAGYAGMLSGSEVFAANVFSIDESGRPSTDAFAMIAALDWLAAKDVGVINISIAGPPSDVLEAMLDRLAARGHIVVAAVGNDGPAAPPLYPSAYDSVTGVTATDLQGRPYRRAGRGAHVDYAAPGVRVRAAAAGGSYGNFTGTSFATPVVAALLALQVPTRQAADPKASQLRRPSTRDLGERGRDDVFGYGLIQLGAE